MSVDTETYAEEIEGMNETEIVEFLKEIAFSDLCERASDGYLANAVEYKVESENAELSYFAKDGNYGDATELVVVNTEKWTGEEWAIVEENSDEDRPTVATQLTEMIESGEIVR
jgi:hypothetical protein